MLTATSDYNRINPDVTGALNASRTGLITTLSVSVAVILLTVFLVVRQRAREIGILKAIGASKSRIGLGFGLEVLFMGLAAALPGIVVSTIATPKNLFVYQVTNIPIWTFLVVIAAATVLGVIASILAVWYTGRVRPAEVLRNE